MMNIKASYLIALHNNLKPTSNLTRHIIKCMYDDQEKSWNHYMHREVSAYLFFRDYMNLYGLADPNSKSVIFILIA